MIKRWLVLLKEMTNYLILISRLANFLGANKKYTQSLEFYNKGIEISLKYEDFFLLDYLYYYKALSLNELDKISERNVAIIECCLVLISKKNNLETNKFLSRFKDDFKITDFKSFFINNIEI